MLPLFDGDGYAIDLEDPLAELDQLEGEQLDLPTDFMRKPAPTIKDEEELDFLKD